MILAMDTATMVCSLALIDKGRALASSHHEMLRGQAEHMFPALRALCADVNKSLQDITAIAVTKGPGSFTGVRLAVAAARALSLALKVPVSGLTTLEATALTNVVAGNLSVGTTVLVAEDAKRGEVYCQLFDVVDADYPLKARSDVQALEENTLPEALNPDGVVIIGSGRDLLGVKVADQPYQLAEAALWATRVESVLDHKKEDHIKPLYIRPPDAKPQKKLWLDQQL